MVKKLNTISKDYDDDSDYKEDDKKLKNSEEEEDLDEVSDKYIFPSFFTFVTWGAFADPETQLNLLLTDDTLKKKGKDSRKNQMSKVKDEKDLNRKKQLIG